MNIGGGYTPFCLSASVFIDIVIYSRPMLLANYINNVQSTWFGLAYHSRRFLQSANNIVLSRRLSYGLADLAHWSVND